MIIMMATYAICGQYSVLMTHHHDDVDSATAVQPLQPLCNRVRKVPTIDEELAIIEYLTCKGKERTAPYSTDYYWTSKQGTAYLASTALKMWRILLSIACCMLK